METNTDKILLALANDKTLPVSKVAKKLDLPDDVIRNTSQFLIDQGLVTMDFKLMKPYLTLTKKGEKKTKKISKNIEIKKAETIAKSIEEKKEQPAEPRDKINVSKEPELDIPEPPKLKGKLPPVPAIDTKTSDSSSVSEDEASEIEEGEVPVPPTIEEPDEKEHNLADLEAPDKPLEVQVPDIPPEMPPNKVKDSETPAQMSNIPPEPTKETPQNKEKLEEGISSDVPEEPTADSVPLATTNDVLNTKTSEISPKMPMEIEAPDELNPPEDEMVNYISDKVEMANNMIQNGEKDGLVEVYDEIYKGYISLSSKEKRKVGAQVSHLFNRIKAVLLEG